MCKALLMKNEIILFTDGNINTAVYNFINDRLADKPAVLKPLS